MPLYSILAKQESNSALKKKKKRKKKKKIRLGAAAYVCNPSVLGGGSRQITKSVVRDQSDQNGETSSLLKIQKLAGHGGACL